MTPEKKSKYWVGSVPEFDDFGLPIVDVFVDGKTVQGPWAMMTPYSYRLHGVGRYGTGFGQRYVKTETGRWIKTEG
jgi:hypothetical protein